MPREITLVDDVSKVAEERARKTAKEGVAIRVEFGGGAAARLDPAKARDRMWAEVLESLRENRQPAYVEIDPKTRYITSLLLPQPFMVTAIREVPGARDLEVDLEISHAVHYVRREIPGFEKIFANLERSLRRKETVLVTESLDSSAIVDVRPLPTPTPSRGR